MVQRKAPRPGKKPTAAPASAKARALFHAPPDYTPGANVWVDLETKPGGHAVVTLLYDYPDLKPVGGWHIEIGVKTYEVQTVAGRALTCIEIPPS